jgi:CheY-like chemotaxis protein/DNA-binding XRE family transcriptional regulator
MGISQEELAWRAGLHRTYIADVERGSRNISLRNIANLASALEMSIAGLLEHALKIGVATAERKAARYGEILMVEDNRQDAELALRAFRKAGISNPVRIVTDGAAAIDLFFGKSGGRGLGRRRPELVLLDLNLPKISGLEVLRRLKSEPRTRDLPVIVLTASQLHKEMAECVRLGAASYIVKPVGLENFWRVTSQLSFKWALLGPEPECESKSGKAA